MKKIMVKKYDILGRTCKGTDALDVYSVICADEEIFVIASMTFNEKDKTCHIDYDRLEAYSNDPTVLTLEDIGFIIMNDK